MKPVYTLMILTAGLFSCARNARPRTEVISVLQRMEDLATVEFTVTKIVKANDNKTWFKPGDRKILMTTEATIKAGINMSQISENDVQVSGKQITVRLPEPAILSVNMPPDKIKVAFEKTDLLRYPFNNSERDALLKQAEDQLRNSATETGIIDRARSHTQVLITRLLTGLGYETVILRFGVPENKQPKG